MDRVPVLVELTIWKGKGEGAQGAEVGTSAGTEHQGWLRSSGDSGNTSGSLGPHCGRTSGCRRRAPRSGQQKVAGHVVVSGTEFQKPGQEPGPDPRVEPGDFCSS